MKTNHFTLLLALLTLVFSCKNEFTADYEKRNFLRDIHPYSKVQTVNFKFDDYFIVSDTINQQTLLYYVGRNRHDIKSILIICQ